MTPSLRGADSDDTLRRLANHRLRFDANAEGAPCLGVDRDDARLRDDDPFATDIDEGIGRAEIDAEIAAEQPEE